MKYLATVVMLVGFALVGCGPSTNSAGESIVLQWTDAATNCHYEVTTKERPIFGVRSKLYVESATTKRSIEIDDDATFGTAALLEDGDWILVASDDQIWAGYNRKSDQLVAGEWNPDALPYIAGAKSKTPLVSRHVGQHTTPAGYGRHPTTRASD